MSTSQTATEPGNVASATNLGFGVASEQIQMSLTELSIPKSILALMDAGKPISYLTNFVTPVDQLMASPSDAAIAKHDLYSDKARQDSSKTVMTWWRRLQRLGIYAFSDLCTWTEEQQDD